MTPLEVLILSLVSNMALILMLSVFLGTYRAVLQGLVLGSLWGSLSLLVCDSSCVFITVSAIMWGSFISALFSNLPRPP